MRLAQLVKALDETSSVINFNDERITDIQYNSKKVQRGSLFICIEGLKTDGHLYAKSAMEQGAVAVVVEKLIEGLSIPQILVADSRKALGNLASYWYGNPSEKMKVFGVTGTNGKTTSAYLLHELLSISQPAGLIGTIGNRVGKQWLAAERTTPESLELQKLFKEMYTQGIQSVAMEVSSHALSLRRVDAVNFRAGIYTNLSQDHLDYHKDMEDYKQAKGRLFELVEQSRNPENTYAVINADDPYSPYFLQKAKGRKYTYGVEKEADFKAVDIHIDAKGATFSIVHKDEKSKINLQLTGFFNVYNVLSAYAVACIEGIPKDAVLEKLAQIKGVPGRLERIAGEQDFSVLVDYAHTPDGLLNLLTTARHIARRRVITVFGCGGNRDRKKRPLMGEVASQLSDYVIVTSDNPRMEDKQKIIEDILQGIKGIEGEDFEVVVDRYEAIGRAINMAKKDDLVIIAGKGHETGQEIQDEIYPFDDRQVARSLLEKLV